MALNNALSVIKSSLYKRVEQVILAGMDKQQQKDIVHDVISGALIGTGVALWQETAIFSSEGKKLSMIGRDTLIGGLIGGAIGFVGGLVFHGRRASKAERLVQEKAVSDTNIDAARNL